MFSKSSVNRTRLVDAPIVEALLMNKYGKSGVSFIQSSDDDADFVCYSSGAKRSYCIRRNSSKYYNSPNFTVTLDKNRLYKFNNTSYVFIDEVLNCLYIVDGIDLLTYIVEHPERINGCEDSDSRAWVILPKKDIRDIISDNPNSTIKYNKQISSIFANCRDENNYKDFV